MSGGIDTGYGDHIDDGNKMVGGAHPMGLVMTPEMQRDFMAIQWLRESNY